MFLFCGACLGCPGEWVNDDRHGHGKQEYRDGSIYDGTWVEDERAGEGRSEYPDHSRYDGRCNVSCSMATGGCFGACYSMLLPERLLKGRFLHGLRLVVYRRVEARRA